MHTEAEARSLINYASAAYCNKDKLVNWSCANCKGPAAGSTETTYFQDNSVASAGFATVNNGQKQIIFSYRGTNEISNWLYNLNIDLIPAGLNGTYKDAELHEGFNDMTNSLFEQTKNTLKNLIGKYPDYKLVFTGHSLGGAIATLTAFKLGEQKFINWEKLNVITYGQPRVGNPKFANYLVSKPWTFTRITAYSDIVAISPGMSMGYYHNQHNMHINSRGKTITCSVYKEDDACIDDFYIPSIDAHFNYWDLKINSECV
ncbi:alpha/beta-hydrolase [Conidiobolus coronatus NRRL 28638]|uniref:Alpha/beta-hydrolase n=1 Tax=Conidiobolus coronatus (strain ATCC 28846 / CBS 209.66 / NRRL 28638) TaxID=796925 RepID=A0A137P1F8_CONC2|nr:alpha/beta-hydrolase [Conidiobolus coronatus NRRL 28638]|eukprot:KXN68905.1 alpha/beta-hydrolase [Conidiobolus coronatus NRRL 28638]